jgi:anti-anti-sigma factor
MAPFDYRSRSIPPIVSIARRGSGDDAARTVVWVSGEHDISTKDSLAAWIAHAALLDDRDVIVDLSGVTFMDGSTVSAIVEAARRLAAASQSLVLRSPSPSALRVIEICGVEHLGEVAPAAAFHPSGAAAALSTWVDVPASGRAEPQSESATPAESDRQPARSDS